MQTPHCSNQTRFFSLVRITSASVLLTPAAAMAFVAVKAPGPTLASSQDRLRTISKFRGDPDRLGGNRRTLPGDQEGGPLLAAIEDYAHRAYPAKDVPMQATLNAIAGFRHVRAMSMGRPAAGAWQLIGPSCSTTRCRVWAGAAGGGIWRTDNALSGSGANWTFVSDSFGTNAIGALTYTGGVLYAGTGEANASGDSEAGIGIYKSTDGG